VRESPSTDEEAGVLSSDADAALGLFLSPHGRAAPTFDLVARRQAAHPHFVFLECMTMAFDTFLLIGDGKSGATGANGEATASGLTPATGWIEIYSYSWGMSNPTTVSAGGGGISAGKVSVSSFNIMKKLENSSCDLIQACCNGQHYATANVVMRKAAGVAGKQSTFLQYDFTDVMVESVQASGSSGGDDTPTESVSFAFAKVKITYSKQDTATGATKPSNNASWDSTAVGPQS
jgi:type VI secretion system secreted protein Hcp